MSSSIKLIKYKLPPYSLANLVIKNFSLRGNTFLLLFFLKEVILQDLGSRNDSNTKYTGNLHNVLEAGPYLYCTPYTDRSAFTAL